jgi:hypothetical protein
VAYSELEKLVEDAWHQYVKLAALNYVVHPALPVLFFGDINQYFGSERRVITVGLNPSHFEFPKETPFTRFPEMARYSNKSFSPQGGLQLIKLLSEYFRVNPYTQWFKSVDLHPYLTQ